MTCWMRRIPQGLWRCWRGAGLADAAAWLRQLPVDVPQSLPSGGRCLVVLCLRRGHSALFWLAPWLSGLVAGSRLRRSRSSLMRNEFTSFDGGRCAFLGFEGAVPGVTGMVGCSSLYMEDVG